MPLNLTPGQFSRRADFYYQLGQLSGVGLGVIRALEQLLAHPPAQSYVRPIRELLKDLGSGFTFAESLRRLGNWAPEFDIALLQAGEQSGRLDSSFRLLSDYYNDRARLAKQIIGDLLYPAFLFHFAVFILPFSKLFISGNWVAYLLQTFGILIPLYAIGLALIYAAQSRHGEGWRSIFERLLSPIPVLGTARYYLSVGRLSGALGSLLSAGVTIVQAWEMAAAASGSPALRRVVLAWRHLVDGGHTPAEVVASSGWFPNVFVSQYAAGEISGQLDDALRRLHAYYQEEGSRKLHFLAQWTPRAVYLLVAGLIAWRIIAFYSNYFQQVQNAIGGF